MVVGKTPQLISRLLICGFVLLMFVAAIAPPSFADPDNALFDLTGPKIEIEVNRAGKKLGIADVPNLLPGDRLWIHVDLPDDQAVHYLLVVGLPPGHHKSRRRKTGLREPKPGAGK